jgi:methyl-accepting chemotaxis protein
MRSGLLSVSDCVEVMDETARDLVRVSAVAEGEAAETAFVSEHTVSNVVNVRAATERLSASISETVGRVRQAVDVLGTSNAVAQAVSVKAEQLARAARDVDAVLRVVQEVATDTNALALTVALEAAKRNGDGEVATLAAELKILADRISQANENIAPRVATICGVTDEAMGSVRSIAQKLELVLNQARTITLAMERQDAVSREIADTMSAAANGTINLTSGVERLKNTIEEARGASMKVVTKAADMADEAQRLDSTVKTFLREVTA